MFPAAEPTVTFAASPRLILETDELNMPASPELTEIAPVPTETELVNDAALADTLPVTFAFPVMAVPVLATTNTLLVPAIDIAMLPFAIGTMLVFPEARLPVNVGADIVSLPIVALPTLILLDVIELLPTVILPLATVVLPTVIVVSDIVEFPTLILLVEIVLLPTVILPLLTVVLPRTILLTPTVVLPTTTLLPDIVVLPTENVLGDIVVLPLTTLLFEVTTLLTLLND